MVEIAPLNVLAGSSRGSGSSTNQAEKCKMEHLLLLVEWPTAGGFGLE